MFEFDLIEKPDYEAIIVALRHLAMIGAIDFEGNLTQIGR